MAMLRISNIYIYIYIYDVNVTKAYLASVPQMKWQSPSGIAVCLLIRNCEVVTNIKRYNPSADRIMRPCRLGRSANTEKSRPPIHCWTLTDTPFFVEVLLHETIFAQIICEPKTPEENRADYPRDFLPDFLACYERSLKSSDWLTYIYLFKSVRLQSATSAVAHDEM